MQAWHHFGANTACTLDEKMHQRLVPFINAAADPFHKDVFFNKK